MRLLVRDGNDLIETRIFHAQPITIGSGQDCDVTIPDRRILPQQLVIRPRDDGVWVAEVLDGGSPVALNGRPLTQPMPVKHADQLGINDFTIDIYSSENETLQEPVPLQTGVPREAAKLRALPLPSGSVTKSTGDQLGLDGNIPGRLAEFALDLRDHVDIAGLIDFLLQALLQQFGGRLAYAGIRKSETGPLEFTQGRHVDGRSVDQPPSLDTYLYRCLDRGQHVWIPNAEDPGVASALVVPLTCNRGRLGILYVDRKEKANPFHEGDLDLLTLVAAVVAAQLDRIASSQLDVQQGATQAHLAFLREIQTRMDPAAVPQWNGFQTAIYCKPGSENSGDVYDMMRLPNGLGTILVASLSGEPVRRALAMAEVRSAFRMAGLHADAPHNFLRSVNWMFCEDRTPCNMDAAVVAINPQTGDLQFSTAGTIGAIVVDGHGDSRDLTYRSAPAVGAIPSFFFESKLDRLDAGEMLALFTKGTWTVADASGRPLGEDRVVDSLRDGFGQSATVVLDELVQDHTTFFKHGRQADDITIMVLRRIAVAG